VHPHGVVDLDVTLNAKKATAMLFNSKVMTRNQRTIDKIIKADERGFGAGKPFLLTS
jgi:hypothetical protein